MAPWGAPGSLVASAPSAAPGVCTSGRPSPCRILRIDGWPVGRAGGQAVERAGGRASREGRWCGWRSVGPAGGRAIATRLGRSRLGRVAVPTLRASAHSCCARFRSRRSRPRLFRFSPFPPKRFGRDGPRARGPPTPLWGARRPACRTPGEVYPKWPTRRPQVAQSLPRFGQRWPVWAILAPRSATMSPRSDHARQTFVGLGQHVAATCNHLGNHGPTSANIGRARVRRTSGPPSADVVPCALRPPPRLTVHRRKSCRGRSPAGAPRPRPSGAPVFAASRPRLGVPRFPSSPRWCLRLFEVGPVSAIF